MGLRVKGSGFWVLGFGLEFWVHGSEFRVLGFGFGFWVLGFRSRASNLEFWVPGFGSRIRDLDLSMAPSKFAGICAVQCFSSAAVERKWRIRDNPGQIMASSFR